MMGVRSTAGVLVTLGLLVAAVPQPVPAGTPPVVRASRAYERGHAYFVRGKHAKAAREFDRALELVADFPEALIGKGHVHMMLREFEAALDYYYRAREHWGETRKVLDDLRVWRYNQARNTIQDYRDRINYLRNQLHRMDRAGRSRAEMEIIEKENQIVRLESVQPLDLAMSNEPPPELDLYIGNALFELQRVDEAIGFYKACIRKRPRSKMAYHNLALGLGRLGEYDEALLVLDQAEEQGLSISLDLRTDLERLNRQTGSSESDL